MVVVVFLFILEQSDAGKKFSRNFRRALKKRFKQLKPEEKIVSSMKDAFTNMCPEDWGEQYSLTN